MEESEVGRGGPVGGERDGDGGGDGSWADFAVLRTSMVERLALGVVGVCR